MNLKPLYDRVIVKPDVEEDKTKGGILIPDTASKEKPQTGEVISVGEGLTDDKPLKVKKGDRVLFGKYGGNDVTIDDIEYKILKENDILAVIVD